VVEPKLQVLGKRQRKPVRRLGEDPSDEQVSDKELSRVEKRQKTSAASKLDIKAARGRSTPTGRGAKQV
jgi:hypothetical protein